MAPSLFAASDNAVSPRAQIVTLHASSTSAAAVAKPSPLLEPVTMAVLSVSWRFIVFCTGGGAPPPPRTDADTAPPDYPVLRRGVAAGASAAAGPPAAAT